MRKPATQAALPIIEVFQSGKSWEVHWDYQEAPESSILYKRREYLDGYIDGALDAIGIAPEKVSCASARTGSVKRLTETQAVQLRVALDRLLTPVVANEFKRLKQEANLPHIRLVAGEHD
ncbi:hypothetical protein [Pseudomonas sp. zfem002]|uniref:hypothetical protein n=1 Tax=Pseudomonas sp. zfem002 TaxID=3078197 RepID=UPI002929A6D1|nr:hypothetical protein [Pseudomonas sp. zfem002]MDU9391730.1 hypothetical protein [Pseudomonas sp. zfem002]